jgi:hypothetical protein
MPLYEMRRYVVVPGRREAVLERFRAATLPAFERHGVRVDRFWLERDDPDAFVYVCAWEDAAEMDATWASFQQDAAWLAAKADSERDGPTVERIERTLLVEHPL